MGYKMINSELNERSQRKVISPIQLFLQEYYGKRLRTNQDFRENACCSTATMSQFSEILELVPQEVKDKYYGCGCPIPSDDLSGLSVLDLGCGSGQDAFILAFLVGSTGFVSGIDMTTEQLIIARRNVSTVIERFGYSFSNIQFHQDFIEVAESIPSNSVDLVVSNCVINLSPRKDMVFKTIHRVLKNGGEFYVSDIIADRRIPDEIRNDQQMIAECLGGAEYEHDWFDLMHDCGFLDVRTFSRQEVQQEAMGIPILFSSITVRGFKFDLPLDRRCEDYGQIAIYKGTLPKQTARFQLDDHHLFESSKPVPVCRNTARMLSETRLAQHFIVSPPQRHFGLFPCSPAITAAKVQSNVRCC